MESYSHRYWHKHYDWRRVELVKDYVGSDSFCLTYGDGLADINLKN